MEISVENWDCNGVKRFRFGLVGLGGYAGSLCDVLETHFELRAVCEPDQATHAAKIERLKSRGVRCLSDYHDLLTSDVDGVVLPLPIDLHRTHTERACVAGKQVLCEKPAAGSVDDLDAMIAARDRANVKVAIGFQHIYDDLTIQQKRQILRGPRPTHATVLACWPRDSAYYARNNWAGKLRHNGAWVLDSPANNALAHYINLALFLLGPAERTSAHPASVEAELYRANAIENYDTCAMRVRTDGDAELMIYLTHASANTIDPELSFSANGQPIELVQRVSSIPDLRIAMFEKFASWCNGDDAMVATLEIARSHLLVVNGASQCSPVHEVSREYRGMVQRENSTITTIMGIEAAFRACAERRMLLSEAKLPWARPGGSIDVRNYRNFQVFAARGVAGQKGRAS